VIGDVAVVTGGQQFGVETIVVGPRLGVGADTGALDGIIHAG
jgi:hypothetical protein